MRTMKDSGVEWIGMVLADWSVIRLKDITASLDGDRIPVSADLRPEGPTPYWGGGGISGSIAGHTHDGEIVLLGEDGAPFDDPLRDVAFHSTGKIWVNNHIHALRPTKIDGRFLAFSLNQVNYLSIVSGSTRMKLTKSSMDEIAIPYPSLSEQKAIASYLDKETAHIDSEIALMERKVALLAEFRKALIFEAVTKGLDRDAPMKDSGVEWIGEIPVGWDMGRIGNAATLSAGIPAPQNAFPSDGSFDGIPFIRVSDLSLWSDRFSGKTRDVISKTHSLSKKKKGTVVFPKSGESIRRGIRKILSEDTVVVSHLACAKAKNLTCTDEFVFWAIESIDFEDETNQTSLPSLNLSAISGKEIPLPPLPIQQAIASHLDKETAHIDQEVSLINRRIDLLKEYRKALIFETVTGKRDVPFTTLESA